MKKTDNENEHKLVQRHMRGKNRNIMDSNGNMLTEYEEIWNN
jgi:hypothetical protein